jgi:hypothetical protein
MFPLLRDWEQEDGRSNSPSCRAMRDKDGATSRYDDLERLGQPPAHTLQQTDAPGPAGAGRSIISVIPMMPKAAVPLKRCMRSAM